MHRASLDLPDITLGRSQRIWFWIVALLVSFAVLRVSPDLIRAFYPLQLSGYTTDAAGVVDSVSENVPIPYRDIVRARDRIVIARVPAFDRKPGLVGTGYSRDNEVHSLPIERDGRIVVLHPGTRPENVAARVSACLRVIIFLAALGLAAMLVLVRPSIATAAIFFFCLGVDAPTTFSEVVFDNPWQQIPIWFADVLHGATRPALVAFAACLIWRGRAQTIVAALCAVAGAIMGNVNAYIDWLATYAGRPRPDFYDAYIHVSSVLTGLAIVAFVVAYARSPAVERRRIGWIAAAFAFAGLARVASDAYYPSVLTPWENGILHIVVVLPIGVVWYSVVRNRAFDVDFVVSRAIVYVAISAAVLGALTYAEEIGTYVFYQKVDLAYGFLIVIFTFVGMATGRITSAVQWLVDRFVFRDRHTRADALAFISGYILDAEHVDDVYRALLEDVSHALSLAFAGVLEPDIDGRYYLTHAHAWPHDLEPDAIAADDVLEELGRSREYLEARPNPWWKRWSRHKDARLHERLSLAAPLLRVPDLGQLVVYGRNVSSLNLDASERERLARLIAHASLAITSIELAAARSALVAGTLITVEPGEPKSVG